MTLSLYLAVPFCRSKCSYCNFASQVYSPNLYAEYAELLARELAFAAVKDGIEEVTLTSIYWGGGTPSLLAPASIAVIAASIRRHFVLARDVEHTVEVAPGTLKPPTLDAFAAAGVNRLSFGVQSFQDAELRAVGRLHRRETIFADLERAHAAGISNCNLDLIAGLPHQTLATWRESLELACSTGVPHLSIYMLEVDEESRLGNELLAGGVRYHAHAVPDDDLIADAYELACSELDAKGWRQYEISNFARAGAASRHNEGYWLRRPYLGTGVDAHSFLPQPQPRRFANPDTLGAYLEPLRAGALPRLPPQWLSAREVEEERYFLGLRRNAGVDLPAAVPAALTPRLDKLVSNGLLARARRRIRLTSRGRLLSNRVFAEFLDPEEATTPSSMPDSRGAIMPRC